MERQAAEKKEWRAFLLCVLGLLAAAPAAAWPIVLPFAPLGKADPEALREEGEDPVAPLRFAGRLLAEGGAPVAGAELLLMPVGDPSTCIWRDNRVQPVARSDKEGRFVFENLDPRDWAYLSIEAPGFVPQEVDLGHLMDRVFPTEFRLVRSSRFRLRAVDLKGCPLEAAVAAAGVEGDLEWLANVLVEEPTPDAERLHARSFSAADAEGAIELPHVAAGRQLIVVRAPHHRGRLVGPLEVKPGLPLDLGEVALEPAPLLRGRLLDPEDSDYVSPRTTLEVALDGLPGAFVYRETDFEPDDDGHFEIELELPAGIPFALAYETDAAFGRVLVREPLPDLVELRCRISSSHLRPRRSRSRFPPERP